jgi:hypothetical protein
LDREACSPSALDAVEYLLRGAGGTLERKRNVCAVIGESQHDGGADAPGTSGD